MFKIVKNVTEPKVVKKKKSTTKKETKEKTVYVKQSNKFEISNQYKTLFHKFMPNVNPDIRKIIDNGVIEKASISYTRAKINLEGDYELNISIENNTTTYVLTKNGIEIIKYKN